MSFRLFADDTQIYLYFVNIEVTSNKINEVMTKVKDWMNAKKLKLNETKTEYLILAKKK